MFKINSIEMIARFRGVIYKRLGAFRIIVPKQQNGVMQKLYEAQLRGAKIDVIVSDIVEAEEE